MYTPARLLRPASGLQPNAITAPAASSSRRRQNVLAGPIFSREALTAPRQLKHYLLRSGYIAALLVLIYTAAQATFGFREIRNAGDMAQFGTFVFDVLAFVQLSLAMAAALLFGSSNVAQEKDRRTLILLLMTDLRNHELVVGKLLAGLLSVLMLIGVSLPVFCLLRMMGGVRSRRCCGSNCCA